MQSDLKYMLSSQTGRRRNFILESLKPWFSIPSGEMSDSILSRFEILLDAGVEPVFKGGEVITGKLRIELRIPIVINAVKLQLKGRAAWINDPMKNDDIEKVYFDQDFTLLERPPGKLEPGHFTWISNFPYSLPFECPLPKQDDGSINEYYVKKAFSMVAPSDGYFVIGEPAQAQDVAIFGKCCCKGKISAELSLPKTGYLPGEAVVGSLKIGNKHPKDILQNMEVRLVDRVIRIGAPEKASTSPYRSIFYKRLDMNDVIKGKGAIERDGIHLFTIPPVCPTSKGDFNSVTNEIHTLSPLGKMMESPSTATLRFRKQPFIRIEYAIQLSLGNFILLEIPIDIGELSTKDPSTVLQPFIAGPQPIEEADEVGKIAFGGPFVYTPVYPTRDNTTNGKGHDKDVIIDQRNGVPSIPEEALNDPTPNISKHTIDDSKVQHEVKEISSLALHKIEPKVINEMPTDIPTNENVGEIVDQSNENVDQPHENDVEREAAESSVRVISDENGETVVTTEVHKDEGTTTTTTTTVTKHTDGSESVTVEKETVTGEETVRVLEEGSDCYEDYMGVTQRFRGCYKGSPGEMFRDRD
uniref:Arrestin_C domain-containing protein n=1 Tax=Heterorhabditis bacteriophora TaxID=37862 RepID=A0A1I7WJ35_HETBA